MKNNKVKKIQDFFNSEIDEKDFALCMRRLQHTIVMMSLKEKENPLINKEWLASGYVLLDTFVELLDPYTTTDQP